MVSPARALLQGYPYRSYHHVLLRKSPAGTWCLRFGPTGPSVHSHGASPRLPTSPAAKIPRAKWQQASFVSEPWWAYPALPNRVLWRGWLSRSIINDLRGRARQPRQRWQSTFKDDVRLVSTWVLRFGLQEGSAHLDWHRSGGCVWSSVRLARIYAKGPLQELAAYLALRRSGGDTASSARALVSR